MTWSPCQTTEGACSMIDDHAPSADGADDPMASVPCKSQPSSRPSAAGAQPELHGARRSSAELGRAAPEREKTLKSWKCPFPKRPLSKVSSRARRPSKNSASPEKLEKFVSTFDFFANARALWTVWRSGKQKLFDLLKATCENGMDSPLQIYYI